MIKDKYPQPLISCIMPTYNRRRFVPMAIRYFLAQDYRYKELLILDDGDDSVDDLIPDHPQIRYMHEPKKRTLGAKRNRLCELASGDIIAHWDDDDWYAPNRLSCQVEGLLREGMEVCGTNRLLFYDMRTERSWIYDYPPDQRFWLSGNTLCYTRGFWTNHRFENISLGEDGRFVWSGDSKRMSALPDSTLHVGMIHADNVSPKQTGGTYWQPYSVKEIRQLLGGDWRFYKSDYVRIPESPQPQIYTDFSTSEQQIPMITVAKENDLALPEYAAFNYGTSLPWMRRWELPFALFQSRLSNTMAVLDCTINPADFQERLNCLYPHVLYRHWSPIQNGNFVLPFGMPDGVFDRVMCINTLEHLLKPQREALLADLATKLKSGGLLILTSDYYFDSFWERPEFLKIGVMSADRQEIFNGWNKITFHEWFDLCRRHDIHPMAKMIEEPHEDDPTLYRQQQPYPHACIAGVFSKSQVCSLPVGKKIVLALLTWNTRKVSIDSVQAYIREARMLRRLGQNPIICVCDNGSVDGTVDALRQLKAEIDVPYKLICNKENLGSSRARNQIIDFMFEIDADYVLFMDGDIEIVPFSSFAMMRYMENNGHRLGCIGADSAWQTTQRERVSPYLYTIEDCQIDTTNLVAWTQYGMFRRAVFEDGIRFDETEPFNRVGWGFEDNDLAFQMEMKGYLNQRFYGMTYLHRDARSSIRIMRAKGIDAGILYSKRKQYVIDKWSSISHINNGPLVYVRQVTMPDCP